MGLESNKVLCKNGPFTVEVKGHCMGENLPDGVLLKVAPKQRPWPGDILVYQRKDGQMVSHRFLGFLPWSGGMKALCRADTANKADGLIPIEKIMGKGISINGQNYQPRIRERIWATGHYFVACARLAGRRIGKLLHAQPD